MKTKRIGTPAVVAIIFIVAIAGIGGYLILKGGEGIRAPAEFEVLNLTFYPSEVEAGEPVEISATVKNVGDLEGTYTVELKIDGEIQETRDVTLARGATETVSFMVTRDTSGTYTIGVNGLQRALNILTPATGNIWVDIWNEDYGFHDVSVFLNGEEIIHKDRLANGYWFEAKTNPFEITGTYELEIKVNWFGSDYWSSRTYVDTVGDEPTHRYYGISGLPAGTPNVLHVDGVWTKFYWVVLEEGEIGLHY